MCRVEKSLWSTLAPLVLDTEVVRLAVHPIRCEHWCSWHPGPGRPARHRPAARGGASAGNGPAPPHDPRRGGQRYPGFLRQRGGRLSLLPTAVSVCLSFLPFLPSSVRTPFVPSPFPCFLTFFSFCHLIIQSSNGFKNLSLNFVFTKSLGLIWLNQ